MVWAARDIAAKLPQTSRSSSCWFAHLKSTWKRHAKAQKMSTFHRKMMQTCECLQVEIRTRLDVLEVLKQFESSLAVQINDTSWHPSSRHMWQHFVSRYIRYTEPVIAASAERRFWKDRFLKILAEAPLTTGPIYGGCTSRTSSTSPLNFTKLQELDGSLLNDCHPVLEPCKNCLSWSSWQPYWILWAHHSSQSTSRLSFPSWSNGNRQRRFSHCLGFLPQQVADHIRSSKSTREPGIRRHTGYPERKSVFRSSTSFNSWSMPEFKIT